MDDERRKRIAQAWSHAEKNGGDRILLADGRLYAYLPDDLPIFSNELGDLTQALMKLEAVTFTRAGPYGNYIVMCEGEKFGVI